jgi:hypothetical protein
MPELMELYWYADTLAILTGDDRKSDPAAALEVDPVRVAMACVTAIFDWVTATTLDRAKVERASGAMLMVAAGGCAGAVIGAE